MQTKTKKITRRMIFLHPPGVAQVFSAVSHKKLNTCLRQHAIFASRINVAFAVDTGKTPKPGESPRRTPQSIQKTCFMTAKDSISQAALLAWPAEARELFSYFFSAPNQPI